MRALPLRRSFHRPELTELTPSERDRVQTALRARRVRCPECGGRRFQLGDMLYLGFLFAAADLDEYMIGLTCKNPLCPAPRTGFRLRQRDFLDPGHEVFRE